MTGFYSTRQRIQVYFTAKMTLKLQKRENRLFLQNHFAFTLSTLVTYVMVLSKRLYYEHYIFRHLQGQQTHLTNINDAI